MSQPPVHLAPEAVVPHRRVAASAPHGADGISRASVWGPGVAVCAVLLVTALLRLRLLAVPLERDEGEYAYMGQLILHGELPYVAAYNMKMPGTYYAYAAILALGGQTDVAIRSALLLINLVSILLVYRLGRRLLNPTAGASAAAAYALLSLDPSVFGQAANAEHFVLLPALTGIVLLAHPNAARRLWAIAAAGGLLGLAVVMKQPGAAFVVFGGLEVLIGGLQRGRKAWRRAVGEALLFAVAALAPFGLTCLAMSAAGAFTAFWFWTVTYAREYVSIISIAAGLYRLREAVVSITGSAAVVWVLAAVGLTALGWDPQVRRASRFLVLFTLCSLLAVCPGLRFSPHYFLLLLPAASLLVGAAVSALSRAVAERVSGLRATVSVGLPLIAIVMGLVHERAYFFSLSPVAVARRLYGDNPFPEAIEIARYVREHTRPGDRVAVIGSEPQMYFYAQRHAATPYLYMYPLMEPQPFARHMQEDMIAQIERERPAFLIFVGVRTSWTPWPDSPRVLQDWVQRTVNQEYLLVGLVEMLPGDQTRYRWDADAQDARRPSSAYVSIFRRRAG